MLRSFTGGRGLLSSLPGDVCRGTGSGSAAAPCLPDQSALGKGRGAWGEELQERLSSERLGPLALAEGFPFPPNKLEHFQFETLRVSNHTACRFAEKTRFFRSLWAGAGRRCAAASRFTFFKVETLYCRTRPLSSLRDFWMGAPRPMRWKSARRLAPSRAVPRSMAMTSITLPLGWTRQRMPFSSSR